MIGQLGQLKPDNWPSQLTKDWLSAIRLHWGTLCFIPGNGAHVCWIEDKYRVIHIHGIKLNTVKSADQYYSSYSYQSSSLISYLMYNDLHHDCKPYEQTRYFSQSPCTVPSCRYFLTLIVLHPPGWDCVAVCIPKDKCSANERRPYMAAGGGMVY